MPSYSKYEIVLIRYPFSDLSNSKVRPAVVINNQHSSQDIIIVPLTSQVSNLLSGEFVLKQLARIGSKRRVRHQAGEIHTSREAGG